MNYLLDTCVISELVKTKPIPRVAQWVRSQDEENLFLSVITIGEIQKGISKLPDSHKKKQQLQKWLSTELRERFKDRILDITIGTAYAWGQVLDHFKVCGYFIAIYKVLYRFSKINSDIRKDGISGCGKKR